jgi:murein DD-endopeptidase MepM/ murein hydrolase activator NlpD
MGDTNLKKRIGFVLVALLGLTMSTNVNKVQAETTDTSQVLNQATDENKADTGIGGMSLLINNYYNEVLSETGISVSNVTTTFSIGGEVLSKVARVPAMFKDLAFANVNDYVNIRSTASTEGEVVGRLYAKAVVTVVGKKDGWTQISSGDVEGYISSDYLLFGEDAMNFANENCKKYAKATSTTLNIRSGPGTEYDKVDSVVQGDELEVKEELDEWVEVNVDSSTGYVSKDYVDYTYGFKYATTIEEAKKLDEKKKYEASHMIWPLPSDHHIYTYFGYRVAPTAGASTYHKGLDIGGAKGSKVVAVLSGTVTAASHQSSAGYYIEIDHGNGLVTRYLHNSELLVSVGEKVNQGDVISLVGSTGVSTGPHLHFSVIKNGSYVDPYPYLKSVH